MPNKKGIGNLMTSIKESLVHVCPVMKMDADDAYIAVGLLMEELRIEAIALGVDVKANNAVIESMSEENHKHRMSGICDCENCAYYRKMIVDYEANREAEKVDAFDGRIEKVEVVDGKDRCSNCNDEHTELCHQGGRCIFCGYAFSADKTRRAVVKAVKA